MILGSARMKKQQERRDRIHQLQHKNRATAAHKLKEAALFSARAPIQRVRAGRTYKTSENENYRTQIKDANYLGVKPGAAAPQPAALITATGNRTSGYNEYRFNAPGFVNDCLQFAQRLTNTLAGKHLNPHSRIALSDGTVTNIAFAVPHPPVPGTFTSNQAARGTFDTGAGQFGQNAATNPAIGQSYAIIPQDPVPLGCVFHIAAVVAKDGTDNITCEADAGTPRIEPVFDIYSTNVGSIFTFHARYHATYQGGPGSVAVTGIIRPPL